jgi:peptide/nickel transport system permease protein
MTSSPAHSPSWQNWPILNNQTLLYTLQRILQGLLTLFLASLLSFLIVQLAPGDFLDTLRQNPNVSPETVELWDNIYGLSQPWYIQYWKWLTGILTRFDFGVSLLYINRSVTGLLLERVPATLLLAIASIILTWLIALPLGIMSAVAVISDNKKNLWIDKILRVLSYLGQGFPSD